MALGWPSVSTPEYLICLECETPCYTFEWSEGQVAEAQCQACGNDQSDQFITEEDLEVLSGSDD
jgi:translation initiation factor 2 beta subunit (eIF-2beta)/eIF-5